MITSSPFLRQFRTKKERMRSGTISARQWFGQASSVRGLKTRCNCAFTDSKFGQKIMKMQPWVWRSPVVFGVFLNRKWQKWGVSLNRILESSSVLSGS
jgi:hypothetical protein